MIKKLVLSPLTKKYNFIWTYITIIDINLSNESIIVYKFFYTKIDYQKTRLPNPPFHDYAKSPVSLLQDARVV